MEGSIPKEKLQPSLLDRLTDKQPSAKSEPSHERFLSQRQLREAIIRDLQWLLSTGRYDATQDLERYPEVANSVLNYGVPELSGSVLSNVDTMVLERAIRAAIVAFEPRIRRQSLAVKVITNDETMNRNSLVFEIEAEAWGHPGPIHFMLKTEMDLEHGHVSIADFGG